MELAICFCVQGPPLGLCLGLKPQKVMPGNGGQGVMALAWAAWYITRLLIKLTPKGVVFLFYLMALAFKLFYIC